MFGQPLAFTSWLCLKPCTLQLATLGVLVSRQLPYLPAVTALNLSHHEETAGAICRVRVSALGAFRTLFCCRDGTHESRESNESRESEVSAKGEGQEARYGNLEKS